MQPKPMGRLSLHSKCLDFFSFKFWMGGGGGFFFPFSFVPNMFPSSSQWVPKIPNVFPIAPRFDPICFAQTPPLLTYIVGPKEEALHIFIESSILGSLHKFNLFFAMSQSNWLIATGKKKHYALANVVLLSSI
jgi:hypothetical protein